MLQRILLILMVLLLPGCIAPAARSRVLMAYFAGWSGMPVVAIPAEKLTHILYAFSDLNVQGQCVVIDQAVVVNHFHAFQLLKQGHPHLKVLISVGGFTNSGNFSANAASATQRQALVQSCIDLWMAGKGVLPAGVIDGIDIDWEFPGSEGATRNFAPTDRANFVALMQEFRRQLDVLQAHDGKAYSLSAAFNTDAERLETGYDLKALIPVLDFFNLMTYDFHGTWERHGPANFHSNLFRPANDTMANSTDSAVRRFRAEGVPDAKIVVGVPFYGVGWTGAPATNHGLLQDAKAPLPGDTLIYKNIKASYENNPLFAKYRDDTAHAAWLYSERKQVFIAYDDSQTISEKAQYIAANELAGAMVWELSQDDATFTLTSLLCQGLGLNAAGRHCM